MKFVSTRDLRNRPGFVRELAERGEVVLTSNGRSIAILLGIDQQDLEETAQAIRQAKAQRAVARTTLANLQFGSNELTFCPARCGSRAY